MNKNLIISKKDRERVKLMEQVLQEQITLKAAAIKMQVSYRQAKRILKRYREEGDKGIIHRNRGKVSPRKIDQVIHNEAIELYTENYHDFGPTLAAEKLWELHSIQVDHETLRRWLIDAQISSVHRRPIMHRERRERRPCFGMLVQFDGSYHDWFEGRRTKCWLMNMVDDATGITLSFLCEGETTAAAMTLLWIWITLYGIPQAVYCDKKNAFVLNREPNIKEQRAGIEPKSHFELACAKLGIEVILANSPQAKGRVERNHAVYQDRFVKELRINGIDTIEDANKFLATKYLEQINSKFAKTPASDTDGHRPLSTEIKLEHIFCYETKRVVSNDFVIRYENRYFQIDGNQKVLPRSKSKIIVRELLDGTIQLLWQDKLLTYSEIKYTSKKERSYSRSA